MARSCAEQRKDERDAGEPMRNPLSKTIVEIEPSGIRKFFDIVSEMQDAISLGVGEPDFDTPWRVRDEAIYSLETRTYVLYLQCRSQGIKGRDQRIICIADLIWNMIIGHEIMVTVGGSEAIDVALRAMLDPGDEVLIPQPSYVSYLPCTVLAGGVPVADQPEGGKSVPSDGRGIWKQPSRIRPRS